MTRTIVLIAIAALLAPTAIADNILWKDGVMWSNVEIQMISAAPVGHTVTIKIHPESTTTTTVHPLKEGKCNLSKVDVIQFEPIKKIIAYTGSSPTANTTPAAAASAMPKASKITPIQNPAKTKTKWDIGKITYKPDKRGDIGVFARVTNETGKSCSMVFFDITALDRHGAVLGSTPTILTTIEPGQTRTIDATIYDVDDALVHEIEIVFSQSL